MAFLVGVLSLDSYLRITPNLHVARIGQASLAYMRDASDPPNQRSFGALILGNCLPSPVSGCRVVNLGPTIVVQPCVACSISNVLGSVAGMCRSLPCVEPLRMSLCKVHSLLSHPALCCHTPASSRRTFYSDFVFYLFF